MIHIRHACKINEFIQYINKTERRVYTSTSYTLRSLVDVSQQVTLFRNCFLVHRYRNCVAVLNGSYKYSYCEIIAIKISHFTYLMFLLRIRIIRNGADWAEMRNKFQVPLMRQGHMEMYRDKLHESAEDLIDLCSNQQYFDGKKDLTPLLYRWALECE